jgi:F-type H+-transporting ATPase subunit b
MDFGQLLKDLGVNLWVVGIQVVVFVTTFLLLSRLLFGRVLAHLQQREHDQAALAERIRKSQEDAAKAAKEYEAKIAAVEKEAYARLQEILKDALDAKAKIVADAQKQAKAEIDSARASIAQEKQKAMAQLRSEVARLARDAAQRILDEPVDEATVRRIVT